jgi:hypothetical protein
MGLIAMGLYFDEFKYGGIHEKHAAAIWQLRTPSKVDKHGGKPRTPESRWPVTGPSGCTLTSSQQSCKQKNMGDSLRVPNICAVSMNYKSHIPI